MMPLRVKRLGVRDYQTVWQAMSAFTDNRTDEEDDQLWVLQHHAVFTQGQAGKAEHLLNPGQIPVVQSDRGGQVTYHGPGQLVAYPLIDLRRRQLSVRDMVTLLEQIAVKLLAAYSVDAYAKSDAPGVYVQHQGQECKIASLGLRVRRGFCFHGISINVDMDLSPFQLINPCGYQGLAMTQLSDLPGIDTIEYTEVEQRFIDLMAAHLPASLIDDATDLRFLDE